MASLNQVSIELKVTGEREATQALKRYSDASDKLNRSVLNAASKIKSAESAWDRANKLYKEGTINGKALSAAQKQIAREIAIVNGYLKSNGALNTQKALAELKAAQATREAAAAEAAANAERQRAQQGYNQLRAAIDQSYAARMRLKQAADTLRAAERQGIITRQQAIEQLRLYRDAAQASAAASNMAARRTNQLGVLMQQTGYQVGDFAVQVQSGTHFMVALGQQATQLVGTFAMLARSTRMIALFSGLGVVIPIATAVIGAFMRANEGMGESADKAGSAIRSVNDAVNDLDKNIPNLTAKMQALQMGFKSVEEAARTMLIADYTKQIIQIDNALSEFGTGVKAGGKGGGGKDPRVTALEQEREELQKLIDEQEKAIVQDRIRQNAAEIAAKLVGDQAQEAKNVADAQKEVAYVLEDADSKMRDIRSETIKVSTTSIALARSFAATADEAVQIAKALDEGTLSAQQLSGVNINAGVLLAAKSAQELAKNLGISLRTAMAMAGMVSGIQGRGLEEAGGFADPRSPAYDPARARIESVRATMESGILSSFRDIPSVGGGGGGGGGGGAGAADQMGIGSLAQSLLTQQEKIDMWREESLVKLQEFNTRELEILGGHAEAKRRIEEEYASRITEIQNAERSERLNAYSSLFGSLATIADVGGKRLLKVQAVLSGAATMIAAYEAAMKAAAEAKTIPGRLAAYAAFVAKGIQTVQQIKSIGSGGGGGAIGGGIGAPASPTAAVTSQAPAAPQRVIIEGLDRDSLISGEQLQNIFDKLYEENEDRGFVFQVAR